MVHRNKKGGGECVNYGFSICFSGVGGFSLGLERSGYFETVAFCEIEPFCRRVLAKHWPKVPCYDDVRELTAARLAADGIAVDAICGGFPCQDLSVAGKQAGLEGKRSGLWTEIWRLIRDIRPNFAIMENVSGLLAGPVERPGGWFGRILGDLAEIGYDAEWHCIPASAVGAPHIRDRIWIVAYPCKVRFDARRAEQSLQGAGVESSASMADPLPQGLEGRRVPIGTTPKLTAVSRASWWETEPALGRVADGLPNRAHRIAALGNAVVPQIPELIGRAIGQSLEAAE